MVKHRGISRLWGMGIAVLLALSLAGCETSDIKVEDLPKGEASAYDYIIGPGDGLSIFVWRNPELSRSVTVKPDGKISVPLVEDLVASGQTSTQLARKIEGELSKYVKTPLVTVMVSGFQGTYDKQIRVVGEAAQPRSLPFREHMTVLDVMIAVGGLTEFAAGNKARIVRTAGGQQHQAKVRLEDLLKDGDISANVPVAPGDIIIIPEAWF